MLGPGGHSPGFTTPPVSLLFKFVLYFSRVDCLLMSSALRLKNDSRPPITVNVNDSVVKVMQTLDENLILSCPVVDDSGTPLSPCPSYALVQATVGVGTVLIWNLI